MEKILTEEKFYVEHQNLPTGVYTRLTTSSKAIWLNSQNNLLYTKTDKDILENLFREQFVKSLGL